jgi:hypothetical protein
VRSERAWESFADDALGDAGRSFHGQPQVSFAGAAIPGS